MAKTSNEGTGNHHPQHRPTAEDSSGLHMTENMISPARMPEVPALTSKSSNLESSEAGTTHHTQPIDRA